MTAPPRCRKRPAKKKMRHAATATAIGCCCVLAGVGGAAAAASSSSSFAPDAAASLASSSFHHGVAPRRNNSEDRRRLERDYYRRLAFQQQQQHLQQHQQQHQQQQQQQQQRWQHQPESRGEADVDVGDRRRRLPASDAAGAIHKKGGRGGGGNYEQAGGAHKKGNGGKKDSSSDSSLDVVPPAPAPAPIPVAKAQEADPKEEVSRPETTDLNLATNLRRFTRIGGTGYALPPSNRYPYVASLQLEGHAPSAGKYDVHMCGGVLVAPDIVMTAAHCSTYRPPGTDERHRAFNGIEVGKVDLAYEGPEWDPYDSDTYKLYYENLVPEKLIEHPNYNEETYENDVMLVKVFGTSRFPPARIARDVQGGRVTVLGWGAESAQSAKKYSDQLKTARLDLLTNDECRDIDVRVRDPTNDQTSVLSLRDHVYDDMRCARSSRRYICYGDAGGPAISEGRDSDSYDGDEVVGIVSWGYGCVDREYPAIMADVPRHYDWIRDIVCRESTDPPDQYGCPRGQGMTTMSGSRKATVSLKLKLDMMAVETGFVIEHRDTGEVVAQRQTGFYKSERYGNEIMVETMELPRGECFRLVMLDAYGDGFCCDVGGGDATLFWGTDTGYYTGQKLAQVHGNFEFDAAVEFCTMPPGGGGMQTMSNHEKNPPPPPPSPPGYIAPYTPQGGSNTPTPRPPSPRPTRRRPPTARPTKRPPVQDSPSGQSLDIGSSFNGGSNSNQGGSGNSNQGGSDNSNQGGSDNSNQGGSDNSNQGGSGNSNHLGSGNSNQASSSGGSWGGPVNSPEFEYCTQFCSSSSHGMLCGNHECVHVSDAVATSDSQEQQGSADTPPGEEEGEGSAEVKAHHVTDVEFYDDDSEYYLTIRIQFDDEPQEVSWVLYDLTMNEVKVFVDFDAYSKEEYANSLLDVMVSMDGPEEGERQYAFTVYDRESNGLCCDHGEGYYKVYLGEAEDDLELLGDDEFEFSSSYYFTLFEEEEEEEEEETSAPTTSVPSHRPTSKLTFRSPTRRPTPPPTTRPPTDAPVTSRPTNPWEKRRPEGADAIGARWNERTITPPGVFHDVGGDQEYYRFNVEGLSSSNAGASRCDYFARYLVAGMALACLFAIAFMH